MICSAVCSQNDFLRRTAQSLQVTIDAQISRVLKLMRQLILINANTRQVHCYLAKPEGLSNSKFI